VFVESHTATTRTSTPGSLICAASSRSMPIVYAVLV
jgi:hypothetical protein